MATATECWGGLQNRFAGLRQHIAKRQLENELASIVRTVAGHKRNKVPTGAPQYRSLWKIADQKVDRFCAAYRADRAEIEAQIPALKELYDLAQAPHAPEKGNQGCRGPCHRRRCIHPVWLCRRHHPVAFPPGNELRPLSDGVAMIWPIVLPSIEFGMWIGWLTGRMGSRGRARGYLIDGTKAARPITFLDNKMEWQTRNASKHGPPACRWSSQRRALPGRNQGIRACDPEDDF